MAEIGNKGSNLDILIRQGATFGMVESTLKDENGSPINLTGAIIRGQIRKSPNDLVRANAEFDCVVINEEMGVFQWGLSYAKTTTLTAGVDENDPSSKYYYDIEVEYPNGRIDPLIYGVARVFREVTKVDPI